MEAALAQRMPCLSAVARGVQRYAPHKEVDIATSGATVLGDAMFANINRIRSAQHNSIVSGWAPNRRPVEHEQRLNAMRKSACYASAQPQTPSLRCIPTPATSAATTTEVCTPQPHDRRPLVDDPAEGNEAEIAGPETSESQSVKVERAESAHNEAVDRDAAQAEANQPQPAADPVVLAPDEREIAAASGGRTAATASRIGSNFPSPSATPPRMHSPPPHAEEEDAVGSERDTVMNAAVLVRASVEQQREAARLAAEEATAQCALTLGNVNGRETHPPPGSSDAPASVSWQGAAYGPDSFTVLPRPSRARGAQQQQPTATASTAAEAGVEGDTSAAEDSPAEATQSSVQPPALLTFAQSGTLFRPKPQCLELPLRSAYGYGGRGKLSRTTAYRSRRREMEVEELAPDGQVRLLPPDRPTLLSATRQRLKREEAQAEAAGAASADERF
jgi:hypothetical protein